MYSAPKHVGRDSSAVGTPAAASPITVSTVNAGRGYLQAPTLHMFY